MSRMIIDALTKTTLIKLASELIQVEERNEKLEKLMTASKAWLAAADDYDETLMNPLGRDGEWYKLKYIAGREAFRRALAEL